MLMSVLVFCEAEDLILSTDAIFYHIAYLSVFYISILSHLVSAGSKKVVPGFFLDIHGQWRI